MANTPAWFDEEFYLSSKLAQLRSKGLTQYQNIVDVKVALEAAGYTPFSHFQAMGLIERTSPNKYFNATEYLNAKAQQANAKQGVTTWNADNIALAIRDAGMTIWEHFQKFGWKEGVNPSNAFDVNAYFESKLAAVQAKDPDGGWTLEKVKAAFEAAGLDPITHYVEYGKNEDGVTVSPAKDPVPSDDRTGGQVFTLTIGEDKLVGGTGNDTFNALVVQDNNATSKNTLEDIDQLDGGAGNDTLNATIFGANAAPVLKSIENINVRFASANRLDLTNATGVTQVTVADSTAGGTVAGVGAVANLLVKNQKQDATFTDNTATTLNLGLDTVGTKATTNTVTVDDVATTLNVTTNNAYVKVTGTTTAKTLSVAATGANVLTLTPTATDTLTVTGAGSVEFTAAFAALKTLNASANTGGVTATVDDDAVTVNGGAGADKITYTAAIAATAKVDLGAGNDTLTLAAASGKGAVVDGGDGIDTLAVTAGAQLDANSKATYVNFEVLQVSANGAGAESFDPTLVSGITSYKVAASTKGVELKNLAAAPTVTVIGDAADLTLTLKDATGTADSATVTLDNGAVSKAGTKIDGVAVTKLTAAGVETLNIHSNGTVSTETGFVGKANSVTLATLDTAKVVIDGSQALTFVTGAHTAGLTIDASAATGKLTLDAALATKIVNINGGTANDDIKAGTDGGLIYGGAGADTITLGAGADSLVYKSAAESQLAVKADGSLDTAKLDVINNFATGADKIDLTSLGFTANTQKVVLEKTVAATDAALWALATSATFFQDATNIARGVVAVSNGTDTYLFADANKDGVFNAADDLVIKLAGLTDATQFDQVDVIFG